MAEGKIAGIFNYCDRWCERCSFTSRCSIYEDESAFDPEQRRKALLESVRVSVSNQQYTNAAAQLSAFIEANPNDPEVDRLRLNLADVFLQQFAALRKQPSPGAAHRSRRR